MGRRRYVKHIPPILREREGGAGASNIAHTQSEAYEHLQKQRRSWRLLPFQVVDSRRELDKQTRPCEMVGWQDRKHLALLTFAQREAIKTLQRENGWPDELESSTSPH